MPAPPPALVEFIAGCKERIATYEQALRFFRDGSLSLMELRLNGAPIDISQRHIAELERMKAELSDVISEYEAEYDAKKPSEAKNVQPT